MRKLLGVDEQLYALHRKWMQNLKGSHVLDLGCFAGNHLSLWIAENCAEYTGIDLSEQAIAALNAKLRERQLTHAHAYMQDFLANSYPDDHFDLVYAFSVLHHFKDMDTMLAELHRVLKPGGIIISFDPLMTEPLNRLARLLYRPLQADRDWEWPFTFKMFHLIQKYFEILDMQGLMGMVKLGFPFQLIPGLERLGQAISHWGVEFDNKYACRSGLAFSLCWLATLQLRKPETPG
jgi:ubiquinone/menaquinone biosynthesis C-methylase UbiE